MNKAGRQLKKGEREKEREGGREGMYAQIILMQPLSVLSSDSRNRRRTEIGRARRDGRARADCRQNADRQHDLVYRLTAHIDMQISLPRPDPLCQPLGSLFHSTVWQPILAVISLSVFASVCCLSKRTHVQLIRGTHIGAERERERGRGGVSVGARQAVMDTTHS